MKRLRAFFARLRRTQATPPVPPRGCAHVAAPEGNAPKPDDPDLGPVAQAVAVRQRAVLQTVPFPAHGAAQTRASRTALDIDMIVIHTSEGPPDSPYGPAHWFADARSQGSAHFSVYSDGTIYQSVDPKDIAWHAGNWSYNVRSIGIEIQAQADKANWNDVQLMRVAALVAALAAEFGIPLDRAHVIGHVEVPNQSHYDPGALFPWDFFMAQIEAASQGASRG